MKTVNVNLPVNQHYLPRFYLKNWQIAPENARVYSYMIAYGKVVYKQRSPNHICSIDHLYTLFPDTAFVNKEFYDIEIFLSNIENQASHVIREILEYGVDSLSIESKNTFAKFMVSLHYRHPKFIEPLCKEVVEYSNQINNELKAHMLQLSGLFPPDVERERANNVERSFALLDHEAHARNFALLRVKEWIENDFLIKDILAMCWAVVSYVEGAEDFFISSDRPLIVNCGRRFQEKNVLLSLPLSPKELLIIFTNEGGGYSEDFLKKIAVTNNFMLMQNSDFVISDRVIENSSFLNHRSGLEQIFKDKKLSVL